MLYYFRSLYWIDAGDRDRDVLPKIEKSAMDGSGRHVLLSEMSGLPRGIAVHHPSRGVGGRMYWTDEMRGVIESAALNGSNRQVLAGEGESIDRLWYVGSRATF